MDISREISSKAADIREQLQSELGKALAGPSNIEFDEPQGFQTEGVFYGQQPPKLRLEEYLKSAVGWVYGCVQRIADAVAGANIRLYEISQDGEIKEIAEHPSLELLDKVNDFTTRLDHMSLTQQYLELAGEAPWFVSRGKNGQGEPESLMLLRPDRLTINQAADKNAPNPIANYTYKIDAETSITIEPSELIFLKYPDPANFFRGMGTLAAAAKTVDVDSFAEDYNRRFFYNSARPDSILSTEQKLSIKQRQQLQQQIRKLYQGGDKAHKTAILESGLKWSPMSISAKDMDFLEQQKFGMTKIFSIFGVPKTIMAVADDVNLANAKVGEYIFSKYTVRTKIKRIVAQLNEFYLTMFAGTEKMFFSFDDVVTEDVAVRIQRYDSGLAKGWLTINEIRYEENLEDIGPAGDITYLPNNVVPIDKAGQAFPTLPPSGNSIAGKPRKNDFKMVIALSGGGYKRAFNNFKAAKKAVEKSKEAKTKLEHIEQKIDKLAYAMVGKIIQQKKRQAANRKAEQQTVHAVYAESYLKSIAGHESKFKAATAIIFGEQEKKILAKFPSKSVKADPVINIDDFALDTEDETQIMVSVYDPLMGAAILEAGNKAAALAGATGFDMATQVVQDYIKNRTFKFSFEVNEETNALLKQALADGVAAGEGIPKLRTRVQELFSGMQDYRAERIARSEVVRASNFAATEAYDQSGVVEGVQWLVTPDDRLCPYCEPLDGKTISLGDNFFNKGDQVTGSDNTKFDLNYEDVEFPPLHSNCRCTVVPIVK